MHIMEIRSFKLEMVPYILIIIRHIWYISSDIPHFAQTSPCSLVYRLLHIKIYQIGLHNTNLRPDFLLFLVYNHNQNPIYQKRRNLRIPPLHLLALTPFTPLHLHAFTSFTPFSPFSPFSPLCPSRPSARRSRSSPSSPSLFLPGRSRGRLSFSLRTV